MANKITLELPGGVKVLNPDPLDPRSRVESLNDILHDPTYYVDFFPILNESDGLTYVVTGGDKTTGWEFEEFNVNRFNYEPLVNANNNSTLQSGKSYIL